ncbi:PadR family transcriptional regulator [Sanguibacter antarcticus]|uniref:PadR family transcriptional regulator n=1 Tax=Sanguibacter antarcticus TaxID=372484 RepID=A0A2A9E6Y4_9MICO|nr:PadR family transcriptional regulator [Sanguibacter antarcticus]PFG33969.1 PadR family transcriptional regulator [Sanguibacter antarcticus]
MNEIARDPQLLKGILPTLVLAALTRHESYGYELVTRLQDAGLTEIAPGTVYPVLARLERDGDLEARLVASPSGPARKYYSPTPAGRTRLAEGTLAWDALARVVQTMTSATDPTTDGDDR